MIDFVDPDTNKLMWRGTARDTVNNPKKSPKKVENAIKKLISKFPPPIVGSDLKIQTTTKE